MSRIIVDTIRNSSASSDSLSLDSSGNVGIGTASPSGKLNLATGASTACELRLTSNNTGSGSGDRGRLSVYSSRNDGTAFEAGKIEIDRESGTEDKARLQFFTNGGAGNPERMRIDSSGNVGIGTTSPDSILHCVFDSGATAPTSGTAPKGIAQSFGNTNGHNAGIWFSADFGGDQGICGISGSRLSDNGGYGTDLKFYTNNTTSARAFSERLRINSSGYITYGDPDVLAGSLDAVRVQNSSSYKGLVLRGSGGAGGMANYDDYCFVFNRMGTDGDIITFNAQGSTEGTISVSGSSVSYNGGVLTRWSQLKGLSSTDKSARPTIYQGTVMSNLDDLCEWEGEENQQLNMTKISDTVGDKDIAGIFWAWDDDDDKIVNDFYIAMTGDMVIRVAASTTVARGDLLISAGDGTAKPQNDDIVRSSTIAKIISTNFTATYEDGSKAYPCVLMAC